MLYAAICLVWLGLPILGVFPPVLKDREHTKNTMLLVAMKPRAWYIDRGISYDAVLAQEKAEWWLKWAVAFVLATPAVVLIDHPIAYAAPIFTYLWAVPLKKQVEYIGHAVEVLVDGRPGYLGQEAARMRAGYSGMFANDDVEAGLRKRFGIARLLIAILNRKD